ncbi:hypothetical protein [Flagellimonas pelagia]|uniref:Sensor of ECF-type sigma factor n=1 Tax=Flagellimonas pelagia TaxID=2306998 RepID=A0A3A1NII5_9FLAO|nr:hypothetical protein [Allomuricauda maritima]RIV42153.1 hypothetical protein D2V05_18860 [Allomuricauda maritima]TXJ91041.1 hypothetical protein FQ017_18700 [Allomuricauda maritima]
MSKKIPIVIAFLIGTFWMQAQGPVRDRIKTLKVAFITERVGLTSKEAQQFWPIYNEHEDVLENIRRKERAELQSKISMAQGLSDADSEELLNNLLSLQNERHNAEQQFMGDIRKVIPAKKVLLLIKAEEDFKKQLLQTYRNRKGGG